MLEMRWLKIAANVIAKSNRERPADGVLRSELKSQRQLSRLVSTKISEAVFAYYRWLGWLESEKTIDKKIARAVELDEQFTKNPAQISDDEFRQKTVPSWALDCVDVSPAWLRALQSEPKIWLRTKAGATSRVSAFLSDCEGLLDSALPNALLYTGDQDLFRTPEFQAGDLELQDITSQAVGQICSPKPGETWWDACAGEGGKTLHLSDLMQNKGLIWASDRADWRLQKLKRRAARAKAFNYRTALWDGGSKLPTKTKFDGILVDAPCSGVGTWQRNPHARWTTSLNDVRELAAIQSQLLANVSANLKPGGKLIYSVCTLTREETTAVADAFTKQFPQFQPLAVLNPVRPKEAAASQLWFWPQDYQGNGMFVAAWQKS